MVALPSSAPAESENGVYQALFGTYLQNRIGELQRQVEEVDFVQNIAKQDTFLHTLSYALKWPSLWQKTRLLILTAAPQMEQAGRSEGWISNLQASIEQCNIYHDDPSTAELKVHLGRLYQLRGLLEKALSCFEEASAHFISQNNQIRYGYALGRRAYILSLQSRNHEALELTDMALHILPEQTNERASVYSVQGSIAKDRHDYPLAAAKYRNALQIWRNKKNKLEIARCLRDLGPIYRAQGQYQMAIDCYVEALETFTEIHDPIHQASTQMNLGIVYMMQEQYKEAIELYSQAEIVFRMSSDKLRLARLYNNQGMAHRGLKRWNDAENFLSASIEIWQYLGNQQYLANSFDELGLLYLEQNLDRKASMAFQQGLTVLKESGLEAECAPLQDSLRRHLHQVTVLLDSSTV